MEDDVIVFVYKRELLEEDENEEKTGSEKEANLINYILTPVEIVEGVLKEVNGKKVFSSNNGKFKLKSIEDISAIDDELLYAFPVTVNEYNEEERDETMQYMKEEDLYKTFLMQNHSKEGEGKLKTFAFNSYSKKVFVVINPDDYDESEAVIEYDISDYAEKLDDNQRLIFRYSDIEKIEAEREEEEADPDEEYAKYPHKAIKYNQNLLYSDELYDEIRKYVLGQDQAVRTISSIFTKNQRIDSPYLKSNFILCGPTGVGKSEIFRRISKIAGVPMITEDSSEFTAEGYVGKSVISVLNHLYDAAGGDLLAAENGIIMMDEIDKKAGSRGANDLEVGRTAVVEALLKMIEGHTYEITVGRKSIYFDTSRVTFAFCGAFSGIEKYADANEESERNLIGFCRTKEGKKKDLPPEKLYNFETLHKYGLLPEFLGRNRIIPMNNLTQEDLELILKESDLSYLKMFREDLKKNTNLDFIYDDEVIKAIAKRAIELKAGARSLTTITEDMLKEINFFVGSSKAKDYSEIIVTKETLDDPKKFILR